MTLRSPARQPAAHALASLVSAALFAVSCTTSPSIRTEPFADALLDEVRRAIDYESMLTHRAGIELRGERRAGNAQAPLRLAFDPSGRFVLDVAGAVPGARGFDGLEVWRQDATGLVARQALGSREHQLADGWLRAQLWLDPWVPRFEAKVDPERSDTRFVAVALRRPESPLEAHVFIDRETRVPGAFEVVRHGAPRRVRLEDWRRVGGSKGGSEGGFRFPHRLVEERSDGGEVVDVISSLELDAEPSYAPPRALPRDTAFASRADRDVECRRGAGGRVYVRPTIDGSETGWFLLDSGFGANAVAPELADELGWSIAGRATLSGLGGRGSGAWRTGTTLELGPLTIDGPRWIELDTGELSLHAGFEVAGVLGYDLFARSVVVIDVATPRVEVHEPRRFLRRELAWMPLALDGTAPCVQGRLANQPGAWLRIDTGSEDTISIAAWASRALDLAPPVTEREEIHLTGSFGTLAGWRGELRGLEVGELRVERARATFLRSGAEGSPLDDPWIAGNLGTGAFAGVWLVLDLGRGRAAIVAPS